MQDRDEFAAEWQRLQRDGLKDSALRREYEQRVRELCRLPEQLAAAGQTEAQIARAMHAVRRELGRQYKLAAPPLLREYIYAATAAKYGDPLGPTYDMLRARKSDREIIASAARPIDDLDDRLTLDGFRAWYQTRAAEDVRIYEAQQRSAPLLASLLDVWERSVRATHDFLSDAEVARIRAYVPQALGGVAHLAVAERAGAPVGFLGAENGRLEMLFLAPEARCGGLGRRLLEYGAESYGIREVTVNEQNLQAVGFYEHMGFVTYKRTDRDEQGGPYPLRYMRRG